MCLYCTQFTISVNHYICISVVCCCFGLFRCVCICSSCKTTYVTGPRPQCALMFDFSPLCVFKCVLNCAPMCTYVSALCVFLKCAHSPHVHLCLTFLHCAFSSNVPTPPCSLIVMGHNIHSLPSQTWGVFCPSLSFVFLLYFICTNVNTSYLYLF